MTYPQNRPQEVPGDEAGAARELDAEHALIARLLAVALGDETNLAAYHALVARYPTTALLCAFESAKQPPLALIRRSRGAYFTFLVKQLCPQELPAEVSNSPSPGPSSGRPSWTPAPARGASS